MVVLEIKTASLFGMSPDVLALKVRFFTSDFYSGIEETKISARHSKSNFAHSLTFFVALPILRKISICRRWFFFGVNYYVNIRFTH